MTASKLHLLPEAYIYGLADTKISAGDLPSYFFGRDYPGAPHLYFPAAFLIKSTLPFLILLGLTVAVVFRGQVANAPRDYLSDGACHLYFSAVDSLPTWASATDICFRCSPCSTS